MFRTRVAILFFLPLAPVLVFLVRADNPGPPPVKKIADFTLKDTAGQAVSISNFKNKKAFVVVFMGTECPINNLYLPRLGELHRDYAARGVQFLGINSNRQDTPVRIAEHSKKFGVPFPVLHDPGNKVADQFGAQRTPEVFLLDSDRVLRYQGRIDDQYGIDFQRPRPTRRDLALALDEILDGKPVSQPMTVAPGCLIGRAKKSREEGEITYSKQVSRILQKNCQECHRPGQIAPMALLTYEDAVAWSETIKEVVSDGRMPPWFADPRHGKFSNDRLLSKEEKEMLLAWIDQGTALGNEKDLPPPRKFPEGWTIGQPDAVISMPEEIEVPAQTPKGGIPYKYYSVETKFDEDKWIERAEAKPDAREVVHHILTFILPPGQTFLPGNPPNVLCGMAPGEMPLMLPPGTAKLLPKGSKIIFQMHYTPNGKAQKDRSWIGLIFAKKPPTRQVITRPVGNPFFRIPPEDPNYEVKASFTMRKDGYAVGFMPHMHLRGKDFLIKAIYPDNREEILLSVPRFNFNWQSVYRPIEPVSLPKGTKLVCVAHFDNSRNNPNNPDPSATVFWGDQTWQEMMIGWTDFAYDIPRENAKK